MSIEITGTDPKYRFQRSCDQTAATKAFKNEVQVILEFFPFPFSYAIKSSCTKYFNLSLPLLHLGRTFWKFKCR